MNRYEDQLKLLKEKFDHFHQEQQSNDNSHQSPILSAQIRNKFQELIQKTPTRCGSYTTTPKDSTDIFKELVNQMDLSSHRNSRLQIEEEEMPKFAYSGIICEKSDSIDGIALFGVQTKANELEVIMGHLVRDGDGAEIDADQTGQFIFEEAYQHITVILEGYSTRETTIIGFDFFENKILDPELRPRDYYKANRPSKYISLLVATADGSVCDVDLAQQNTIKGHDTLTIIRFDVDIANKTNFPIKKDFSRMKSTSLEAIPITRENQPGEDQPSEYQPGEKKPSANQPGEKKPSENSNPKLKFRYRGLGPRAELLEIEIDNPIAPLKKVSSKFDK